MNKRSYRNNTRKANHGKKSNPAESYRWSESEWAWAAGRGAQNPEHNEQLAESNSRMRQVLEVTKDEIEKLRQEVEKLKAPPLPYGIFLKPSVQEGLAVISVDGKQYEVNIANEDIKMEDLKPGTLVLA